MSTKEKSSGPDTKIVIGLAALLLVLVGALAAAFLLPPNIPRPVMPDGDVRVYIGEEDTVSVCWPELPEGWTCLVSIQKEGDAGFTDTDGGDSGSISFSVREFSKPAQVRLSAAAGGKNLLGVTRKLRSDNYLEFTLDLSDSQVFQRPKAGTRSPENGAVELSWDSRDGVSYEVCRVEETADGQTQYTPVKSVTGGTAVLRFGQGRDLEMPEKDKPVDVAVRSVEQRDGYTLYGPPGRTVSVTRDSLLSGELSLDFTETDVRMYTLSWNETRGDYYEIQEWNNIDNRWDTVWQVAAGGELSYETGRLPSGTDCQFQVIAYHQAAASPTIAAGPAKVSFRTAYSPLYATVWPIQDQPLRGAASAKSETLMSVPGGTALCVLEEKDGYFYVRYKDSCGYVDSRFCMIDLTEYVGDLCDYDITNSYQSVFMVHDYSISKITGRVIKGFENVRKADGNYLVPFLYPSAQKLIKAAEAAGKDGYKLKIYEAYRPNEATRFLYDTTLALLDTPILDQDGNTIPINTGAVPARARTEPEPAEEEEEPSLPPDAAPNAEQPAAEPSGSPAEPEEPAPEPEPEPKPEVLTLGRVMTDNGRFRISSFLAASVSNHNRGVALDLTLETLDGLQELEMQSAIHDLSWYAATDRNNDNARLLEKYMKDVGGMTGLSSEWWHFQDDEIKAELKLTGYLAKGVSAEGWKKDDTGWQYRKADGSVYRNTSVTIDGKPYSFNADGYAAE